MDSSRIESLWVLVRRARSHWKLLLGGAVLSAGSYVLPPLTWFYVAMGFGITIAAALFMAFHDVRIERDSVLLKLEPAFDVRDDDPACRHVDPGIVLCRIAVENVSAASIHGVKASLVAVRGQRVNPLLLQRVQQVLPLPLRPQHMRGVTAESVFSLAPNEKRLVDVVSVNDHGHLVIWQSVPDLPTRILAFSNDVDLLFDIQVVGADVCAVTRTARVEKRDGHLTLSLLS